MDNRCRLISITPNTEYQILYCARVSSDQGNTDVKLLNYLIRNKHWSPFEMCHAVFEIYTSRAIAAQILRHRSFSFQEYSQRYSQPNEFIFYEARRQAEKNRQSSVDDLDERTKKNFNDLQGETIGRAQRAYLEALDMGVSREQARMLLPLSTATKLYMSGTIRSWIHYIELRTDPHTQQEHRVIAEEIRNILAEQMPYTAEALQWPATQ